MFFIVNVTKNTICISDLSISLGPRQATDLDERIDRWKVEKSKDLKSLIKTGRIKIKHKDGYVSKESAAVPEKDNSDFLDSLKQDINSQIQRGIADLKDSIKGNGQPEPSNNEELLAMMQNLIQQVSKNNQPINNVVQNQVEEEDMDENVLSNIHAKSMDKRTKNLEAGNLNYIAEEVDNSIDNNISELENLL